MDIDLYSDQIMAKRIMEYENHVIAHLDEQAACRLLLSVVDVTSLEGTDNRQRIEKLCQQALSFADKTLQIPAPAAVCVYMPFIAQAKLLLLDSSIKVATVACGFPSGQLPLSLKLEEVKYAVDQGVDEIDMVISRGKLIEGNHTELSDEIAAVKEICEKLPLKVILETGELGSAQNIYTASRLAMAAGADFIKTSTGKIAENATATSVIIMADAISDHYSLTKKMVGIKPSGGITSLATAMLFLKIIDKILGKSWLNSQYLRLGTSQFTAILRGKIN